MYEAYFNLQKRPFSATPDPNCCFAPEAVQNVLDELVLRAESGEGIGVVTGAAGTGKTLICRRVAAELSSRMTPVFLANANFPTRRALLQSILFELGRKYSGLEEQELRLAIFGLLRELTLVGRSAVLIVDEAHLLSDRLLEELRLLACLAEEDQPLARVILAGQPALEERFISPALEALNQRITCHLYLEPLTRAESIEYVNFRIAWAGGQSSKIFSTGALNSIAAAASGLPRCLNQLCDHALLLTFVQEQPQVTAEIVEEALLDLRQLPLHWNTPLPPDTPLAPLRNRDSDPGAEVEMDDEGDVGEQTSVAVEFGSGSPSRRDTVCFEVGGDEQEYESSVDSSESISLAEPLAAEIVPLEIGPAEIMGQAAVSPVLRQVAGGVVPLPDVTPQMLRGLTEEPVVDHYARLDAGMPRLARTFEDAPVPMNWQPVVHSDVPAAPQPPTLPITSLVDVEMQQVILDDDSEGIPIDETVDDLPDLVDEPNLDAEPRLVGSLGIDSRDLEERLGSSVIEVCREVHAAAVGNWQDGDVVIPASGDQRSLADLLEDVVHPEPIRQSDYDVVEPEGPVSGQSQCDVTPDERRDAVQSSGRYVPKPKYRMIFSTLRRRLGRNR